MTDATSVDPACLRRVAVSSLLGTAIEYYDFLVYGTMSALVFGIVFFPESDPAVGTIAAFGTLAAGYLARPVGGILFGHFGDRVGRKAMLVLTMSLMGTASFAIGLLPTFAAVGFWRRYFSWRSGWFRASPSEVNGAVPRSWSPNTPNRSVEDSGTDSCRWGRPSAHCCRSQWSP